MVFLEVQRCIEQVKKEKREKKMEKKAQFEITHFAARLLVWHVLGLN
jgi:hypothetical protein